MIWLLLAACSFEPAPIPPRTKPCEEPDHWPMRLASDDHPFLVHHRPGEEEMAETVREYLDTAWRVEVDELGFSPPLPDDALCGPDDAFDVFLWDGLEVAWVDAIDENPDTPHDDWFTYMAVDAWGPYAGPILDGTLAHELNHACQAADDWFETPIAYEMTSTFMEDVVFDDDDDYATLLVDFQQRPHWALDHFDDYATWYMYASSMYLHFVRDRFFAGDARFVADMWRGARNPAGDNEPDFEDALDDLLDPLGSSYLDSAVEFARWRWYVAGNDDGAHFEEGASWPEEARVAVLATVDAPQDVRVDVMALGSAYVDVHGTFTVSLEGAHPAVDWVVQALPGAASDGDLLTGPTTVTGPRTIVVTALPLPANADPDDRGDDTYVATLRFAAP